MGFNSAFKGLNAKLNSICPLLALLGAHHILHVSKQRVKAKKGVQQWDVDQCLDVFPIPALSHNLQILASFQHNPTKINNAEPFLVTLEGD